MPQKIKTGMSWIKQAFSAQAVKRRILIRRKKSSVHLYASYQLLERYCKHQGFHLVETGDQYVVFCNDGHIKVRF
jgi:hypothetical protein